MPAMNEFPPAHMHTGYADGFTAEGAAPRAQGPKAFAISTNKTLTSKFRGVCWNKKNKRWQAAINSNGRYLYLGSYDTQDEAARIFDKAAVRVRGPKARINFCTSGYFDSQGNVLPDAQIESLLLTACNPTKQRRHRNKDGELVSQPTDQNATNSANQIKAFADIALQALARFAGSGQENESIVLPTPTTGFGINNALPTPPSLQLPTSPPSPFLLSNMLASGLAVQQPQQAAQARQVALQEPTSSGRLGSLSEIYSLLQSNLPEGAKLDSIIPSESAEVVGALYLSASDDRVGACIWNKDHLHDLGLYGADKDAKQACLGALKLVAKISKPRPPAPVASAQPQPQPQQQLHSVFSDMQAAVAKQHALAFQPRHPQTHSSTHSIPALGISWGCAPVHPQQMASCSQHVIIPHPPVVVRTAGSGSVYLPTAATAAPSSAVNCWEMQASQPDPAFCEGTREGTGHQATSSSSESEKGESLGGINSNRIESSRANRPNRPVLHRLADVDVGEAVQLFIASKRSITPPTLVG